MIKNLIQRAIEQKNTFINEDIIKLQIEFFLTAGKLTEQDKTELLTMFPQEQETVVVE